jgi:excisionase family DNA binding protein
MTDQLLTAREVGEVLRVSTETVLCLTRRGVLPATRIGGALRYSHRELLLWLERSADAGGPGSVSHPTTSTAPAVGTVPPPRISLDPSAIPPASPVTTEKGK